MLVLTSHFEQLCFVYKRRSFSVLSPNLEVSVEDKLENSHTQNLISSSILVGQKTSSKRRKFQQCFQMPPFLMVLYIGHLELSCISDRLEYIVVIKETYCMEFASKEHKCFKGFSIGTNSGNFTNQSIPSNSSPHKPSF